MPTLCLLLIVDIIRIHVMLFSIVILVMFDFLGNLSTGNVNSISSLDLWIALCNVYVTSAIWICCIIIIVIVEVSNEGLQPQTSSLMPWGKPSRRNSLQSNWMFGGQKRWRTAWQKHWRLPLCKVHSSIFYFLFLSFVPVRRSKTPQTKRCSKNEMAYMRQVHPRQLDENTVAQNDIFRMKNV